MKNPPIEIKECKSCSGIFSVIHPITDLFRLNVYICSHQFRTFYEKNKDACNYLIHEKIEICVTVPDKYLVIFSCMRVHAGFSSLVKYGVQYINNLRCFFILLKML